MSSCSHIFIYPSYVLLLHFSGCSEEDHWHTWSKIMAPSWFVLVSMLIDHIPTPVSLLVSSPVAILSCCCCFLLSFEALILLSAVFSDLAFSAIWHKQHTHKLAGLCCNGPHHGFLFLFCVKQSLPPEKLQFTNSAFFPKLECMRMLQGLRCSDWQWVKEYWGAMLFLDVMR